MVVVLALNLKAVVLNPMFYNEKNKLLRSICTKAGNFHSEKKALGAQMLFQREQTIQLL
jgi:hypothetical protein